jgi:hypothetical protein
MKLWKANWLDPKVLEAVHLLEGGAPSPRRAGFGRALPQNACKIADSVFIPSSAASF